MTKKVRDIYQHIDRLIYAFAFLNVPCKRIALTETQFNTLIQARKNSYGQHVNTNVPLFYQGVKLYLINHRNENSC